MNLLNDANRVLEDWKRMPLYPVQEELLKTLVKRYPNNEDLDRVNLKVKTLNLFYSTGIRATNALSEHIAKEGKKIDEALKKGDPNVVSLIAKLKLEGGSERAYASAGGDKESSVRQKPSAGYPLHVNMPAIARRSTDAIEVYGIEVTSDGTIFYMIYTNASAKTVEFSFSEKTYLVDKMTGERYHLLKADGCAIYPKKTLVQPGTSIDFELFFPQLPSSIRQIDLCNPNSNNPIWLYGITIQ